jgi:hypothetical protein
MTRFLVAPVAAVAVLLATPAHALAQLPNLGNCIDVEETLTTENVHVQVCTPPTA